MIAKIDVDGREYKMIDSAVGEFDQDHHRSTASFSRIGGHYINNFLFLYGMRIKQKSISGLPLIGIEL